METVLFTVGELSKLYDLSKQTLLYYEKLGLLVPHKVETNGYRYYSEKECQRLELIVSLKKLGLSLKDIYEYVEAKGTSSLEKIFKQASEETQAELDVLYSKKLTLEMALYNLHKYERMPLNMVFFQMGEEEYYYETNYYPSPRTSEKERMRALLKHQKGLLASDQTLSFYTGFVIDEENLKKGHVDRIAKLATRIDGHHWVADSTVRPRNMYLSLFCKGNYFLQAQELYEKFRLFMERNGLVIAGDLYVEPLKNYWTEELEDTYLLRLSLPVDSQESL